MTLQTTDNFIVNRSNKDYKIDYGSIISDLETDLDPKYVLVSGDNMTGNLTLGTDKIKLNADGKALFAGGNTGVVTTEGNVEIYRSNPGAGANVLQLFSDNGGTKVSKVQFFADGSMTAASRIKTTADIYIPSASGNPGLSIYNASGTPSTKSAIAISDIGGGTPKSIELKYDGSAEFAGTVEISDGTGTIELNKAGLIRANRSTTTAGLFQGQLNGVATSTIKADGSAELAGGLFEVKGNGRVIARSVGASQFSPRLSSDSTLAFLIDTSDTDGSNNKNKLIITKDGTHYLGETLQTGNLENTSQIKLTAADGSAEFAGYVDADLFNASRSTVAGKDHYVSKLVVTDTGKHFNAKDAGGVTVASINADGSCSFAGGAQIGPSYDNVFLSPGAGDGTRPSQLVINGRPTVGANDALRIDSFDASGTTATTVAKVTYDGSLAASSIRTENDSTDHISLKYTASVGGAETGISFRDKRDAVNAFIGNYLTSDGVGTADADLVFKTSDNGTLEERVRITDTGDVLIGGSLPSVNAPNIALKTDGSASFVDSVSAGGEVGNTSTETGVKLFPGGAVYASQGAGTSPVFYGMINDGNLQTSRINGDGSAKFAGDLTLGDDPTAGALTGVKAYPGGGLYVTNAKGDSPVFEGRTKGNGNATSSIKADGSAKFDGILTFDRGEIGTYVREGRVNVYGSTATASADIAYAVDIADDVNGLNQKQTVKIKKNGSATFTGSIQSGGDPASRGDAEGVILLSNGRVEVASNQNSTPIWSGYKVGQTAATSTITADGTITGNNVTFNLEADDDTKYTATTDSEGVETLVYNGAVLNVKELLISLQTAAARIESLEARLDAAGI